MMAFQQIEVFVVHNVGTIIQSGLLNIGGKGLGLTVQTISKTQSICWI